jgi:hypothetical protein
MNEIFFTDKCILLIYPTGASGKLLSNCLTMNNNFIYQHIEAKIYDNPRKRFDNLMCRIEKTKKLPKEEWDDLELGDIQFFGIQNFSEAYNSIETHRNDLISTEYHYSFIKQTIKENKHFFRVCHNLDTYNFYKQMWPNSKKIFFCNALEWILLRDSGGSNFYEKEYFIKQDRITEEYYKFDCLSYRSQEKFLIEYKNLLHNFKVEVTNLDLVAQLYKEYMNIYFCRQ